MIELKVEKCPSATTPVMACKLSPDGLAERSTVSGRGAGGSALTPALASRQATESLDTSGLQLTLEGTAAMDVATWKLSALHDRRAALIGILARVEADIAVVEADLFGILAPSPPRSTHTGYPGRPGAAAAATRRAPDPRITPTKPPALFQASPTKAFAASSRQTTR